MKKIEMLYSLVCYPQKYKTMQLRRRYREDGRMHFEFAHGAIAFVPIWPAEFYRGTVLPLIQVQGIDATLYKSTWKEREAEGTYQIILPTDLADIQLIYNEADELATIEEIYPENETTWRNNNV